MLNASRQRGATLTELVITIVILAITSALAAPSFKAYLANSRIRHTADGASNGLQLARSEALSRNTKVRLTLAANSSWSIGCVVVTATCPAALHSSPADHDADRVGIVMTLADGSTLSGPASVDFDSLGRRTGSNPMVQLEFDLPGSVLDAARSREMRITISATGQVRLCDPNVSAGDSRAC